MFVEVPSIFIVILLVLLVFIIICTTCFAIDTFINLHNHIIYKKQVGDFNDAKNKPGGGI